jgi:hypothetical protein
LVPPPLPRTSLALPRPPPPLPRTALMEAKCQLHGTPDQPNLRHLRTPHSPHQADQVTRESRPGFNSPLIQTWPGFLKQARTLIMTLLRSQVISRITIPQHLTGLF